MYVLADFFFRFVAFVALLPTVALTPSDGKKSLKFTNVIIVSGECGKSIRKRGNG